MEKLKIAIIGVGGISEAHISAYKALGDVELYAFCDINEARLNFMGNKHGITRLYTDEAKMLSELPEIDAVSICTWNSAHAPCTIMALDAGKHVLCEKPMALNAKEAEAMLDAAKRNDKKLMIGFVRRFGNDAALATDLIGGGKLGEIYYGKVTTIRRNGNPGGWFGDKSRSGGGPLIDLGVHVIDLTRYLVGKPKVRSVYAATFTKLGAREDVKTAKGYTASTTTDKDICDCEDLATALIRFDNGFVLSVEVSFSLNTSKESNTVELFGTKGGVGLTFGKGVELYNVTEGYMSNVSFVGNTSFEFAAFSTEIKNFVDTVKGVAECRNPAEDGLELMKILDAIYASAESGHEVIVN